MIVGLLVAWLAAGCAPAALRVAAPSPLSVLTSVTVLADLVRRVGGERVDVRALVPSGADPLTYQPAPRDVLLVAHSQLVFFNGLGLDRAVRALVTNAARPDLPTVVLSDGLPTLDSGLGVQDAAQPGGPRGNPYLWLDPRLAAQYVERIRDGLATVAPADRATFAANADRFLADLRSLDRDVEAQLAAIPPSRRKLLTLHDGFPYFAARYDFKLVGVAIKTPGRAPSAREIADISRLMREQEVRTVYIEPQLDARLLKLAARDAGLNILTLYSDTLDQTVPSYEALLRYNARQLVNGLT